jgi:hypothetical protein
MCVRPRRSGLPSGDGQDRETLPGLAAPPGGMRFPPPPPGGPGEEGGMMTAGQLAEMERRDRKAAKKAMKVGWGGSAIGAARLGV